MFKFAHILAHMTQAYEPGTIPTFEVHDRADKAIRVAGITRAEVAEYIGIRPETMSRYLSGKSKFPTSALRLIALRTGVPFEWLKTGEPPSPGDGDGGSAVRHQGLEPRTRWFGVIAA